MLRVVMFGFVVVISTVQDAFTDDFYGCFITTGGISSQRQRSNLDEYGRFKVYQTQLLVWIGLFDIKCLQLEFYWQILMILNCLKTNCFCFHFNDWVRSQIFTYHDSSAVVACAILWLVRIIIVHIGVIYVYTSFGLWAHQTFVTLVPVRPYSRQKVGVVSYHPNQSRNMRY